MADLQGRVRERLRADLLRHGASPAFNDAELFADVERILHAGADMGGSTALLLPELLGDPATWRLETALRLDSHRGVGRGWPHHLRQAAPACCRSCAGCSSTTATTSSASGA